MQQAHIFDNADPENAIPAQQARIFDNAIPDNAIPDTTKPTCFAQSTIENRPQKPL